MYADDLAYVHHTGFADLARGAAAFLVDALASDARRLARPLRIADLGCGSGLLAKPLVEAGHDVTCVDLSRAMLALAREHVGQRVQGRVRFVEASLYDVGAWARGTDGTPDTMPFDAVLAVGEPLSYLLPDEARAPALGPWLGRIARVLAPRGRLVFDVIVAGTPALARRSFVDDPAHPPAWTVCVDTRDDGRTLTRDIATFTKAGRVWLRSDERHVVRVLDVAAVKRDLVRAGFTVRVARSYGDHALAVRRRAFLCHAPRG